MDASNSRALLRKIRLRLKILSAAYPVQPGLQKDKEAALGLVEAGLKQMAMLQMQGSEFAAKVCERELKAESHG